MATQPEVNKMDKKKVELLEFLLNETSKIMNDPDAFCVGLDTQKYKKIISDFNEFLRKHIERKVGN